MDRVGGGGRCPDRPVRATARAGAGKGLRRQDAVRMDHGPALRLGITTHAHRDHAAHAQQSVPEGTVKKSTPARGSRARLPRCRTKVTCSPWWALPNNTVVNGR
jgi:hypothetical protein